MGLREESSSHPNLQFYPSNDYIEETYIILLPKSMSPKFCTLKILMKRLMYTKIAITIPTSWYTFKVRYRDTRSVPQVSVLLSHLDVRTFGWHLRGMSVNSNPSQTPWMPQLRREYFLCLSDFFIVKNNGKEFASSFAFNSGRVVPKPLKWCRKPFRSSV